MSLGKTTSFLFLLAGGAGAGAGLLAGTTARAATDEARLGATEAARIAADSGYPSGKATPAAARAASASRHPLFLRPPGFRPSALFFWISSILEHRVDQAPRRPGSMPGGGGALGAEAGAGTGAGTGAGPRAGPRAGTGAGPRAGRPTEDARPEGAGAGGTSGVNGATERAENGTRDGAKNDARGATGRGATGS